MTSEKWGTTIRNTTGDSGGDLLSDQDKQFFSNREIWRQVFGEDGRGGAIGNLHDMISQVDKRVDDKFQELEDMICSEFAKSGEHLDKIQAHLKIHNGVNDRVTDLEKDFTKHTEEWEEFAEAARTEEKVQIRLGEEHQKGVDEGDRNFNKRVKVIALYLTIAGIIVGIILKLVVF